MLDIGAEPEVFGGEVVEPGGQGGGLGPLAPEGVELRGDMPQLAVGLDEVIDTHLEVGRRAVGAGHLGVTRPWTRLGSGPGARARAGELEALEERPHLARDRFGVVAEARVRLVQVFGVPCVDGGWEGFRRGVHRIPRPEKNPTLGALRGVCGGVQAILGGSIGTVGTTIAGFPLEPGRSALAISELCCPVCQPNRPLT